MSKYPQDHELGRIDAVTLDDRPALSRDVHLDLPSVQAGWPVFEGAFESLRGRKMMGLVYGDSQIYRMCTLRLEQDTENPLGLDETTVPGGKYLRLRLRGEPMAVYGKISSAFDALLACADLDPTRPLIESYRREGEVDCLMPIIA